MFPKVMCVLQLIYWWYYLSQTFDPVNPAEEIMLAGGGGSMPVNSGGGGEGEHSSLSEMFDGGSGSRSNPMSFGIGGYGI